MKTTRRHRHLSLTSKALALAACALPTLLVAACDRAGRAPAAGGIGVSASVVAISAFTASPPVTVPQHQSTLTWTTSGSPTKLTLDPGAIDVTGKTSYVVTPSAATTYELTAGSASASTTIGMARWSQLSAFLSSYCCTNNPLDSGVPRFAFILADRSGPATPLHKQTGGGMTVKDAVLIASATKMPAAAAILNALYKHPRGYTPGTTVATIVGDYIAAAQPGQAGLAQAKSFAGAWTTLEKALPSKFPSPQAITIGQLLSMTSGLTTDKHDDPVPRCLDDKGDKDPYTSWHLGACATDLAIVDNVVFSPGTQFGYSYAGYQIAGYLATLIASHDGVNHAGDWIGLFRDTFKKPLGLGSYRYNNDLTTFPDAPSPEGTTVTNPRIAGGGSCDAEDYSTILTAILDDGVLGGAQVLAPQAAKDLKQNQLPPEWSKPNPDDGMKATSVYHVPSLSLTANRTFRGYSFGLFLPTSEGETGAPGFFKSLNRQDSLNGSTPKEGDLTPPHASGKTFMNPGLFGAVAWLDTDSASPFTAVVLVKSNLAVGLDMIRTADSAISCQFKYPGTQPYPTPDGGYNPPFCVPHTP